MRIARTSIGFPFVSILRNALRLNPPASAALWVGENSVAAEFSNGSSYHPQGASLPVGAPLLMTPVARGSAFSEAVFRPNGMERDGEFTLVVDHPGAVLALIQTRNLPASSTVELARLPVETLMPSSELPSAFLWEILSSNFASIPESGPIPATVVLVGLPQNVCWWAETWAESIDGRLRGVWPSLLAILHWCRRQTPTFAFIPGDFQSFLTLFDKGHLRLIMKLPSAGALEGRMLEGLMDQISAELQLLSPAVYIYPAESAGADTTGVSQWRDGVARCVADLPLESSKTRAAVLRHLLALRSI